MTRQGKKSLRGQAEIYDEVKVPTSLALTPMGRKSRCHSGILESSLIDRERQFTLLCQCLLTDVKP